MDFPSFSTLFRTARNEALARNPQLTRGAIDRDGSDANILVAAATAAADEVMGQLSNVTAGLYLDSATGEALDRLLADRYGLTRKVAAAATGSVQFTTASTNPSPFTIPVGTILSTSAGTRFATVQNETFLAGGTGPVFVGVRSLLAGADQQAAIGTITNIESTIPGAPANLSATNPIATFGASDRESDTDFRERGRAFFTTARRGTLAALVQGALTVPGVVRASAYEALDSQGRGNKLVYLVIADQYTDTLADLGVNPPAYEAQSAVLAQTVFNALEDYRPAGIFVQVQVAKVILQPVQLSLSFNAGVNIDQVAVNARAACVNVINNLNPGDDLTPLALFQALQGVSGLVLPSTADQAANVRQTIVSPSGTVVTSPLEVLRANLAIVQASSSNPGTPIGNYTNPDAVQWG